MSRDNLRDALRRHIERANLECGKVHHLEIRHDDDCAHWMGKPCDCEPEIESGARIDRKYGEEGAGL